MKFIPTCEFECENFTTVGRIFEVLYGAQIMHTIYHFKACEVRNPMLQTVHDLDLKRRSYGHLKIDCAKVRKFRTLKSKVRKILSKVRNSKSKILHTSIQGAKISHHAKHSPGTRVAFRTAQAHFRTVRIKVRKFRTPQSKVQNSFQNAKIRVQCANSLNVNFAHHYSRYENFRTV